MKVVLTHRETCALLGRALGCCVDDFEVEEDVQGWIVVRDMDPSNLVKNFLETRRILEKFLLDSEGHANYMKEWLTVDSFKNRNPAELWQITPLIMRYKALPLLEKCPDYMRFFAFVSEEDVASRTLTK